MAAIDDLFAQVYEHPDDDEVRLVLADALLAAGDPRGELIQLQFHPEADHERRTMELLQRHGLTWLGALRDHVVPIRYERGFVASCVATDVDDDIVGVPEWATIRTVEVMCANRAFLLHTTMRSLRRIHGIRADVLERILLDAPALAARLEALRVMDLGTGYDLFTRFPSLREVGFDTALALRRDDRNQLTSLEGWFDPSVVHLLETLPPNTLTRVALRGMHHVPGLPEALARHPRAVIDQRARIRPLLD